MNEAASPMKLLVAAGRMLALWAAGWLLLAPSPALALGQSLPGNLPLAVRALRSVGALPGTNRLNLAIGLPLRDRPGLSNLLAQIYRPGSKNYHQFLTARAFGDRFGPTPADYQSLIRFTQAHGLMVTGTHPNRMLLDVAGSVSQVEQMCHVNLRQYPHPRDRRNFFAPDTVPALDLGVPVLHISGLDNYQVPRPMNLARRTPAPLTRPWLGSAPGGAYWGNDFRRAYVPGTVLTGLGQQVGLLQLSSGFFATDIARYENLAGMPAVPVTAVLVDNYDGGPGMANDECSLDIEMTLAMAPGLQRVLVYEGTVPDDILNRMATDDTAQQLSSSWAFPVDPTTEQIFQQFAAQGQSFFNASGDDGAWGDKVTPPSDDANITIVGGTTLSTGADGTWAAETVWHEDGTNGSGGGISAAYPIPAWQQGVDMSQNQGSLLQRNLPDVAMVADNVYVCYGNGTNGIFGGTSCAAPLWAGFTALLNQQGVNNQSAPAGFINPAIYALGEATNYPSLFHDISNGNNTSVDSPTAFYAVPGYDLCTGWGTPAGQSLIDALVGPAQPTPPFLITQPQSQTVVDGITLTLHVLAAGSPPLYYQWTDNGTNLPGATNAWLTLAKARLDQSGNYRVRISNAFGTVKSSNAVVRVISPASCDPTPAGLVSWWSAEGNGVDLLGQNNGTPMGDITYTNGEAGQAFGFDGSTSDIAVPASPSLDIGANGTGITIECWIQPSALNVHGPGGPLMEWDSPTASGLQFWADGTLSGDIVDINGNHHPIQALDGLLETNHWQHVALTYEQHSGNACICLNGSLVAVLNLGSFVPQTTYALNIGQRTAAIAGVGEMYVGLMDELAIYNRALTTNEIQAIYLAGGGGKCFAPPLLVTQAPSQTTPVGATVDFAVNATGSGPLAYQWFYQGAMLPGATNDLLSLNGVQPSQAGAYAVVVTNAFGMVMSSNAQLTIIPPTGGASVPPGMAGWWAAEDNTIDTLGLNSGISRGAVAYTAGEVGDAFAFDGRTNYLSVPASPSLDIGATGTGITIEGWVQPSLAEVSGQGGPIVEWDASTTNGLQFWADGRLHANLKDTQGNDHLIESAIGLLDVDNWQHVALTYDKPGGEAFLYLNGLVVAAQNLGSFIPQTTYALNIGRSSVPNVNGVRSYGGSMDELAIYNRALDANEIQAIQQAGVIGKCFTPPVFLTQPAGQTVLAGSTVAVAAIADGMPSQKYQWLFQGLPLAGATHSLLVLTNAQLTQSGTYQLAVTNALGVGFSSNAVLVVNAPPTITGQPTNLTVRLGSLAVFAASATGTSPLVYQWKFQGTNISGATNSSLTLANVQFNQAGKYSVQVSNSLGSVLSTDARLTVWGFPPVITVQPTNQVVLLGKSASFYVAATGTGPLFYQWFFKATNILADATNASVTLATTQTAQAGNYSVFITNTYGQTNSTNATLTFLSPPLIVAQPLGVNVKAGTTTTFKVAATGAAPLAFQWYLNSTNNPITRATSWSYTILNTQPANAGNYLVVISNLAGVAVSSNASLKVHFQDHFAWSQIPSPRFARFPFLTILQAQNSTNGLVTNFNGTVSLSCTAGMPIQPAMSGAFINGSWTGLVTVVQAGSNLVLQADDGLGDVGQANTINVINAPALMGSRAGSQLHLFWPTNPGGFVMQTASRLNATNWMPVTNLPSLVGSQYLDIFPIQKSNSFYRLFYNQP